MKQRICSGMDNAIDYKKLILVMKEKILVTETDYNRLMTIVEPNLHRMTEDVSSLYETLNNADKVSPQKMTRGVVTMNSKVLLKDLKSGRELELTVTYPQLANHRERLVSVLSPIGVRLIGRHEKETVSWRVPTGMGSFEIAKVTYQPEAAGHYHL